MTSLEYVRVRMAKYIAKVSKEIESLQAVEEDRSPAHAIGFAMPPHEEDDEEEFNE